MKTLKRVTDRFNLFNDGRQISANKRKYVVKAVQNMIGSQRTQELLRLGEAFGYYGHQPRQRANKLNIGETEVIMINGRPVVVENIPSNRTVSITCSDDGIVEHTQEFLDTDTGKIALGLHNSGAGGWSWATGGKETREAAITNSYHGMDYVLQPNYLSLDHPAMMLESANRESMILESLQDVGFDVESASNIFASLDKSPIPTASAEQEIHLMYLESVNAELSEKLAQADQRSLMLLDAMDSSPIYVSNEVRQAVANLNTDGDMQVIKAFFESFSDRKLESLPTGLQSQVKTVRPTASRGHKAHMIDFGSTKKRFS